MIIPCLFCPIRFHFILIFICSSWLSGIGGLFMPSKFYHRIFPLLMLYLVTVNSNMYFKPNCVTCSKYVIHSYHKFYCTDDNTWPCFYVHLNIDTHTHTYYSHLHVFLVLCSQLWRIIASAEINSKCFFSVQDSFNYTVIIIRLV